MTTRVITRTTFYPIEDYDRLAQPGYSFLPFKFTRLDDGRYLLTNDTGKFLALRPDDFHAFVNKSLSISSPAYADLKANHLLTDSGSSVHAKVLASQYRTKKSFVEGFTKLHIFVVSLRCDHSCPYCQVSRQSADKRRYDMSPEMARRSIDLVMRSPAPAITIEFQGGEPLLNFDLIQYIVESILEHNKTFKKTIDFVICTNLSTLNDKHLDYCNQHGIKISTSLDGPAFIHDQNRPFGTKSSHATVVKNIGRVKEALGKHNLSALMTTTKQSLRYHREIVDEYVHLDMGSIFIRSL